MWLMTKHGFYSIVEKLPGEFHIRSREREDLQNLIDRVPLPAGQFADTATPRVRNRPGVRHNQQRQTQEMA